MKGIFEPSVWRKQKAPPPLVAECGACGLHKFCKTPYMPVSGKGEKKVLIIAEAPGEYEDLKGIQLVGNAGMEVVRLLNMLDINMRRQCWLTNAVICRPMDKEGQNREPTNYEIGYCRPNLAKTLKALQPDVIIPMGKVSCASLIPLAWKSGEVDDASTWVGWNIPSQKLNAWICPTYHPSFLLRAKDSEKKVIEMFMLRHLKAAFEHEGKPWKELPDLRSQVKLLFDEKDADTIKLIGLFGKPIAIDYETNMLKPDSAQAEILCCAVSDGTTSYAYPWVGKFIEATKWLLTSNVPKIVANLPFEDRWSRKKLGIVPKNWQTDVVAMQHWRDCRGGICSVKFQAFVYFGLDDYDYVLEPYKRSKDDSGNSPNRLKEVEPRELLLYCGIDALVEWMLADKHTKDSKQGVILATQ